MQFLPNNPSICKGDSAQLLVNISEGKSPYTYFWPVNGATTNSTYVSPSYSHIFTMFATDFCGVLDSTHVKVNVVGPTAEFTYSQTGARDFVFLNKSTGALYSYWNFGDGDTAMTVDAAHTFPDSGFYTVLLTVENREGCYDTFKIIIRAFPDLNVYIPNAFTPNKDGINDTFYAIGEGFIASELRIFDRWGQDVFRSKTPRNPWDGLSRNDDKLEGTFCYTFEFITPLGQIYKRNGHVTVIR
jgi:gliding motility-associated-like protein